MNYQTYRAKVVAEIVRRLNGKPNFPIDDEIVEYSHWRKHHPSVPAQVMIEKAIEAAKAKK